MGKKDGKYEQESGSEALPDSKAAPERAEKYKILKVKFSFESWFKNGESIYGTPEDLENNLSLGAFHSGTVFEGTIKVPIHEVPMLQNAIKSMATPIMAIFEVELEE